jgi:hypothetical protein
VQYRLTAARDERIEVVVDLVSRTHVNGGMLVSCLESSLPHEFDSAVKSGVGNVYEIARKILSHPIVETINSDLRLATDASSLNFCTLGRYALEGQVTDLLLASGAYIDSDITPDNARDLSRRFVDAISDEESTDLIAYRTYDWWADWFCDVAWDLTLVVQDSRRRRWWLICVTDTD